MDNRLGENITNYLLKHCDNDFVDKYNDYINSEPSSFIRLNSSIDKEQLIENLKIYNISLKEVKNFENVFEITKGKETAGKTVEFILGDYYIQSLSSMIPPLILNPTGNDKVIDLCSAPGSKTTQLAGMMNNEGTLYANESSGMRIRSLVFNLEKMHVLNAGVINAKGENLSRNFDEYFDKILVDAPCSALGIIQKKNEVDDWWNSKQVDLLSTVQYKLLVSAIKMCKTGGEILYSTCTLTLEENELVLQKILEKYPVELVEIELPVKSHPGFTKVGKEKLFDDLKKTHRIFPWEINSEGFFIAKLRKTNSVESSKQETRTKSSVEIRNSSSKKIKPLLKNLSEYYGIENEIFSDFKFIIKGNEIFFINAGWETDQPEIFLRIGNKFGKTDKRDKIFLNSFAAKILNENITRNIFEIENIDHLKTYMTGGTIKIAEESFGQRAVKFRGKIIGTASASSNGIKSQFPRNLRTQNIIFPEFLI